MKICTSCRHKKPEWDFPSPNALMCNFCTPETVSAHVLQRSTTLGNVNWSPRYTLKRNPPGPDKMEPDTRPLIDMLHEATFNDKYLHLIKDHYALRMLLRKATRFTLDDTSSEMIADFSLAIAPDVESARRLAIPPFPVTWFEFNNIKRLNRVASYGIPLTSRAKGETSEGAPVERVGWLIHPADIGGFYATYCAALEHEALLAPLSYWWHTGEAYTGESPKSDEHDRYVQRLCFGMDNVNVSPLDAFPTFTPLHVQDEKTRREYKQTLNDLMRELSGELRHIMGLLVALGAREFGVDAKMSEPSKSNEPHKIMKNGKPLLPLEHKVLHLHLLKKRTPQKIVAMAVTHHKRREHKVRAHLRRIYSADGSLVRQVPVKAHKRGDERLGRIEKTYLIEK